tara:strand:+ start:327 stop:467 length:141 start_codon:yes stop_codon:yes gene_type:complete
MKEIYDTLDESVLLDEDFDDWAEDIDILKDLTDKFNTIIKQEKEEL